MGRWLKKEVFKKRNGKTNFKRNDGLIMRYTHTSRYKIKVSLDSDRSDVIC